MWKSYNTQVDVRTAFYCSVNAQQGESMFEWERIFADALGGRLMN